MTRGIVLGLALAVPAAPALADVKSGDAVFALAHARLAEEAGTPVEALQALARVSSLAPDLPGLSARILEQAIAAGDLPTARDAASKLWQAGERRLDVRLVLMTDAIRRSDWKAAREYGTGSPDKTGRDPASRLIDPVVLGWADVAMRAKRPEAQMLTSGRSGTPEPVYALEAALMQLVVGRPDDAQALVDSVTLTDRSSQLVALRVVDTFEKQGLSAAAAKLRGRIAIAAGPRDDPMLLLPPQAVNSARGGVGQWFGMIADGFARTPNANAKVALLFARVSFWLDADDWQGRSALVEALVRNDLSDQAATLLSGARADLPPVLAVRRAELVAAKGDMTKALAIAAPAVESKDTARALLLRYADLARRSGNAATAQQSYDRLLATLGDGEADEALKAALLIAKAEFLLKDDRWDAAAPLLEQAVALRPNDAATLNFAGYSALERRTNVDQAMERIEAAWRQEPQNAGIIDSLGWAYYLTGKHDQAIAFLEKAQRGAPDNPVIIEHLGDAYWASGQKFDARYVWRAAALLAEPPMAERLASKLRDGLTPATVAP